MKLMTGNMFDHFHRVDHFIVATHSKLDANGHLSMSTGQAAKLAESYPDLPEVCGRWLSANVKSGGVFYFHLAGKVGLFQNMTTPNLGTSLGLISGAAKALKQHAEANPDKVYALEAPNGKDPLFLIEGLMRQLPDNVEVWVNG